VTDRERERARAREREREGGFLADRVVERVGKRHTYKVRHGERERGRERERNK